MASLDADTCQWVRSAKDPEAVEAVGKGVRAEDKAGERPLRSTHGVLLCLARALPPDSRHKVSVHEGKRCLEIHPRSRRSSHTTVLCGRF